jgi:glycosyltransferase involved in cell wall biosynthesis
VIEALASGVPVAAYPVTGPIDILGPGGRGVDGDLPAPAGAVGEDLGAAIASALACGRADAARLGARYSWEAATDQFACALEGAAIDARRATAIPA